MATCQAHKEEEQEEDQLHKQFQHLQDDWTSYKQSLPRRRRRSCSTTDVSTLTTADFLNLIHASPKKLVSSLQQTPQPPQESSPKHPEVGDRAVEEVVAERHAAIRSGKLRGRRLLEALERAKDEAAAGSHGGGEEVCSVCSSVLVHGAELSSSSSTSSSFCSSCAAAGEHSYYYKDKEDYISSSSSPYSVEEYLEEEGEEKAKRLQAGAGVGGDGGMWMVTRISLFAAVTVALALGFFSLSEFGMEETGDCCMTPT